MDIHKTPIKNRIFGLDILRALAIILVVATHGRYLVGDTVLYEFPYLNFISGVDLFFILSGFLIGTILLKEISASNSFGFSQLAHFWKRRWYRTLPNYYLFLALNYITLHFNFVNGSINEFSWKYFFFLQNFSSSISGFFPESWSLTIEEWFYFFAPFLLLIFFKFFKSKYAFLVMAISMILLPNIYRMHVAYNSGLEGYVLYENTAKTVLTRLDAIAYGLLAAWVAFYFLNFWKKFKWLFFIIGVIIVAILANADFSKNFMFSNVIIYSLSCVGLMCYLPLAHSIKNMNGFIGKAITFISEISYSMYLINLSIGELIKHNFPADSVFDGEIKYAIYWIVVIMLSTFVYKFYEKPIMDLRDKKR